MELLSTLEGVGTLLACSSCADRQSGFDGICDHEIEAAEFQTPDSARF
jgi:hypothetical protein